MAKFFPTNKFVNVAWWKITVWHNFASIIGTAIADKTDRRTSAGPDQRDYLNILGIGEAARRRRRDGE
jgi:hypothetical protein